MDPARRRIQPAPSSHGHRVGPPVFASVAGGTETTGDAPLLAEPEPAELELDEPDEPVVLVGMAPLGRPDGVTWNGAEKTWGLVKSC